MTVQLPDRLDPPFVPVRGRAQQPRRGWAIVPELRFAGVKGWMVRWNDEARLVWVPERDLELELPGVPPVPDPVDTQHLFEQVAQLVLQYDPRPTHELTAYPMVVMARPWIEGAEQETRHAVILGNWSDDMALVWFPDLCHGRLVNGRSVQPIMLSKITWSV
jgi:hypothetical protein